MFSPGSTSLLNGSFGFRGQGYLKVTSGSVGTSGLGFIGLRFISHLLKVPKSFKLCSSKREAGQALRLDCHCHRSIRGPFSELFSTCSSGVGADPS